MYYEAYKNIDRDRLDLVNIASDLPRRQGRTFMFLLQMLGEVWLGDPNNQYIYVGETQRHSQEILRDFVAMVKDEGFAVEVEPAKGKLTVVDPKPCSFYFISGSNPSLIERMSRGIRWSDVYVDLTYETADKVQRQLDILLCALEMYHVRSSTH